ncbi:EF-hand domain-containing protein [Alisedimentitalea sp. MJ-SS2]|uniref:EF-hand domain-containing protein n=1 Tax=Aliisedimentitalea sp. MJ-SS2 TaxID=3049795 RepID=UPI002910C7BE|nr:EF-hand domain-containing protein [Alisedimentitalea sp. MJ-SS2]MDU8929817.1 EF-hand domain-containing protein [Alisedimentitalea sp. MJ-SS2]
MTHMSKTLAALGLILSPTLAFAAVELDANGDGMITIEEMQAVYTDTTAEAFSEMDTNGDGALDDGEMQAAQESGLIKPISDG